jgi:hypothetical protein
MFGASELVFGCTDGVGSRFHVLRSRACFLRYLRRWILFSGYVLPDSFLMVPRASSPVFMFCDPKLVWAATEGAGTHFHVFAPVLIFDGTEGVWSSYYVLR